MGATTKQTGLATDVLSALANAERSPGWNNRIARVSAFNIDGCMLYVVPARLWAYRRSERQARDWQERAQT